jgi:hypothetical protein
LIPSVKRRCASVSLRDASGRGKQALVTAWLRKVVVERSATAAERQERRAEMALRLSTDSVAAARRSNAIAWFAAVVAALALLVSIIGGIVA